MMKVTEAFNMFVDEQLFRNNSPKTLIWYRENLGAFFRWLGVDSSLDDLTIFNYKAYCSYLLHEYKHNGKPLKSSSVNSHVRCVKAFYNFCIQEDLIPDFSRKLKTTKVHNTEKLPLDDEEINLLLQSFGDTVLERRNFCWVVLMCAYYEKRRSKSRFSSCHRKRLQAAFCSPWSVITYRIIRLYQSRSLRSWRI